MKNMKSRVRKHIFFNTVRVLPVAFCGCSMHIFMYECLWSTRISLHLYKQHPIIVDWTMLTIPKRKVILLEKMIFVIVCLLSNGSSHSNIYCTHLLPTFAPWGSSQKRCTFKGVFFRPAGFYDVVLQISPISGANRGWCFVRWPKRFFFASRHLMLSNLQGVCFLSQLKPSDDDASNQFDCKGSFTLFHNRLVSKA